METPTPTVTRAPGIRFWMAAFGDTTRLEHLTIPGTRHSAACFGPPWAVCQDTTVEQQLNSGIRYLDLRCRAHNGAFTLHHGEVFQNIVLGEVLGDCWDFLRAHPSETVLMRIGQEYSAESDDAFRSLFDRYHRDWRALLLVGDGIPALGEARGRVVVLGDHDGLPGVRYGDPALFDLRERAGPLRPVDEYPGRLTVTCTGAVGEGSVPRDIAAGVNRALLAQVGSAAGSRPGLGIVAMDFPESEPGLVRALVEQNGGGDIGEAAGGPGPGA
ncbi:phosphatidylinositol-specific phospholipase C domain-containing protein [Streptomyces qinzhouensis]|uniref:1-phosphatidylinositol phosphodiesterase n=1 Tax=Streptomyces qinzhouensis TaxID=2599401 RepID=A0A5B8J472_9ACTN|nr:phosphatidylinositol-specific phospholipase C domain-containing protein [Streptomyces qinzhouensis]QDY76565.1 phosphatidylinositol-specific phospholipase C domain-containing protein [Streptomyces qinzhouensis]